MMAETDSAASVRYPSGELAPPAYRHPGRAVVPLVLKRGEVNGYGRQHVELQLDLMTLEDMWVDTSLSDGEVVAHLLAQWIRGVR